MEAPFTEIGHRDFLGPILKEAQDAESDGAGPENEGLVGGAGKASVHGMLPDAEHFNECKLIQRRFPSSMQLGSWNGKVRAHASIGMDSEDTKGFAAVGLSFSTSNTFSTTDIRHYHNSVTFIKTFHIFTPGDDFRTQLR